MSKIVVWEPLESIEGAAEGEDRHVVAVSEESFNQREYVEYEDEVLETMEDLGFFDCMAFSYQPFECSALSFEESLEKLKADPRVSFIEEPDDF